MEIVNKIRECKKDREIYETLIEASKKTLKEGYIL